MSAKHINKYEFKTEGVLATNNKVGQQGSKAGGETTTEETTEETSETETSTQFRYPSAWKNKLPQFPFVPREDELTRAPAVVTESTETAVVTGWEDGQMPVFPFSAGKKTTPPQK